MKTTRCSLFCVLFDGLGHALLNGFPIILLTFAFSFTQELKGAPLRELRQRVLSIYNQYLAPNAVDPLNVDSRISESIRRHLSDNTGTNLDRYCFEEAETHIFHLMKSDSYYRFLRSDYYRELFTGGKKKSKKHRAGVSLTGSGGPGLGTASDTREVLQLST